MIKTFRVAGFAAIAFFCSATSVAAEDVKAVPTASAAVVSPILPTAPQAPAIIAEPAPIVAPAAPAAEPALPVRSRPDHQPVAPAAVAPVAPARGLGVTGIASARRPLVDLVAEHSAAPIADEEFECLASAVYFESRGEPLEGQLAVAEVILNRVKSGRFRSTICDVVKQPSQFSFVRRGVIPAAPRESAAWARSVAIAHIALNNLADATGDESLFFHATYVNPRWGRPRIARIGNHIFYR
jgi:hypothetical protein